MGKPRLEVVKMPRGDYRLRVLDEHGDPVRITPGSIPGIWRGVDRSSYRKAVQASLRSMYEAQQSAAKAS